MTKISESTKGNNANTLLAFRCSDEEWNKAIIEVAREKGYGNEQYDS